MSENKKKGTQAEETEKMTETPAEETEATVKGKK